MSLVHDVRFSVTARLGEDQNFLRAVLEHCTRHKFNREIAHQGKRHRRLLEPPGPRERSDLTVVKLA